MLCQLAWNYKFKITRKKSRIKKNRFLQNLYEIAKHATFIMKWKVTTALCLETHLRHKPTSARLILMHFSIITPEDF